MVSKIVYEVIKNNPGIQNDDNLLVSAVWRYEGWSDDKSLEENLKHVTNSETITRVRRKLHETGKITYSEQSMKRRTKAFKEVQDTYTKRKFNWFK